MAKKRQHQKASENAKEKVTLFQYLTAPESLPALLQVIGGIAVSLIPGLLHAPQSVSMILGLVGMVVSMIGLKSLMDRMPDNR